MNRSALRLLRRVQQVRGFELFVALAHRMVALLVVFDFLRVRELLVTDVALQDTHLFNEGLERAYSPLYLENVPPFRRTELELSVLNQGGTTYLSSGGLNSHAR